MRIGLVCPYSLTVPGGVQTQALGLLRSFRAMGHEARLLAPCDGPPPDAGVTPLGNSIATSANGSIAPLAPDPSAALRTIRALRDEDFDVLHLHEPLAPGATVTAALFSTSPMVGTFHAAGDSAAYRWLVPLTRWVAKRLTERCAVSEDARKLAQESLGGEYRLLYNGIETDLYTKASPTPSDRPTIFFIGRHEPRKGLDVLLEAMAYLPAETRLWVGSDGPDTVALKARFAGDVRVEWLGRLTDAEKASRMQGADVFCAPSLRGESFGVVLLEAMAARARRSSRATFRGTATSRSLTAMRSWCPPATPRRSPRRSGGCSPTGPSRLAWLLPAMPGPGHSRWTRSPRPTWGSTTTPSKPTRCGLADVAPGGDRGPGGRWPYDQRACGS